MTNWVRWHDDYETATSSLSRRPSVVTERLARALMLLDSPASRAPSLCAGDWRDVISEMGSRRENAVQANAARAVPIESNPVLAERTRRSAQEAGLDTLEVRCAATSELESFRDLLPVDLVMPRGVFGNIGSASSESAG